MHQAHSSHIHNDLRNNQGVLVRSNRAGTMNRIALTKTTVAPALGVLQLAWDFGRVRTHPCHPTSLRDNLHLIHVFVNGRRRTVQPRVQNHVRPAACSDHGLVVVRLRKWTPAAKTRSVASRPVMLHERPVNECKSGYCLRNVRNRRIRMCGQRDTKDLFTSRRRAALAIS